MPHWPAFNGILTAAKAAKIYSVFHGVRGQMDLEKQDPRHLNVTLDWSSVGSYMRDYAASLKTTIEGISADAVQQVWPEWARRYIHHSGAPQPNQPYLSGPRIFSKRVP